MKAIMGWFAFSRGPVETEMPIVNKVQVGLAIFSLAYICELHLMRRYIPDIQRAVYLVLESAFICRQQVAIGHSFSQRRGKRSSTYVYRKSASFLARRESTVHSKEIVTAIGQVVLL